MGKIVGEISKVAFEENKRDATGRADTLAHIKAMNAAGWVQPEPPVIGQRVLVSLANGWEAEGKITRVFKNKSVSLLIDGERAKDHRAHGCIWIRTTPLRKNPESEVGRRILEATTRTVYVSCYADRCQDLQLESGSGQDWLDIAPAGWSVAAQEWAEELWQAIVDANHTSMPPGTSLTENIEEIWKEVRARENEGRVRYNEKQSKAKGARSPRVVMLDDDNDEEFQVEFGHYIAMEAMGQGVGWSDNNEKHGLKVPKREADTWGIVPDADLAPLVSVDDLRTEIEENTEPQVEDEDFEEDQAVTLFNDMNVALDDYDNIANEVSLVEYINALDRLHSHLNYAAAYENEHLERARDLAGILEDGAKRVLYLMKHPDEKDFPRKNPAGGTYDSEACRECRRSFFERSADARLKFKRTDVIPFDLDPSICSDCGVQNAGHRKGVREFEETMRATERREIDDVRRKLNPSSLRENPVLEYKAHRDDDGTEHPAHVSEVKVSEGRDILRKHLHNAASGVGSEEGVYIEVHTARGPNEIIGGAEQLTFSVTVAIYFSPERPAWEVEIEERAEHIKSNNYFVYRDQDDRILVSPNWFRHKYPCAWQRAEEPSDYPMPECICDAEHVAWMKLDDDRRAVETYFFPERHNIDVRTPARLNDQLTEYRTVLGGRFITTTYQVVTPESSEDGDVADQGWEDEAGQSMEPDEYDVEEGIERFAGADERLSDQQLGACYNAVKFLESKYVETASGGPGCWYIDAGGTDLQSGETTTYEYHLENFDPLEEQLIYNALFTPQGYRRRHR